MALEIGLTGDPITAERACQLGLVNRVVPTEQVVDETVALADRIARNSPTAVRVTRRLIREAVDASEAEGWRKTMEAAAEVGASGDGVEGATAFIEKREPVWNQPR